MIDKRKNLIKEKEERKQQLIKAEERINNPNQEKELEELIKEFLKLESINKIDLYRLIDKIEIDKEKNIYIYFNFLKPNKEEKNK